MTTLTDERLDEMHRAARQALDTVPDPPTATAEVRLLELYAVLDELRRDRLARRVRLEVQARRDGFGR